MCQSNLGVSPPSESGRRRRIPAQGWLAFLFLAVPADAQVFLGSARQVPEGSWHATVHHQELRDRDLNFSVRSGAAVAGPCSGSPVCGFSSNTASVVPAQGDGSWTSVRVAFQPWDQAQYFVSAGGGRFALDVASVAVTNRHSGDRVGWTAGAGMRINVIPETPATPAIAFGLSGERSQSFFNEVRAGAAAPQGVDERLDIVTLQGALWGSKRFGKLEPYAGVVWTRTHARLKDLSGGGRAGGTLEKTTPALGCRIQVFPHEALVVEAVGAGATAVQAAWEFRFK